MEEDVVPAPFITLTFGRIREGRREDFERLIKNIVQLVEELEPRHVGDRGIQGAGPVQRGDRPNDEVAGGVKVGHLPNHLAGFTRSDAADQAIATRTRLTAHSICIAIAHISKWFVIRSHLLS